MIIGDPAVFAIESEITVAYERLSQRALGFFVVHVAGRCYGVKTADASMLGVVFNDIAKRIKGRGTHNLPFLSDADSVEIAKAFSLAVYSDQSENKLFFGMRASELGRLFSSKNLVWEGDEAFDDGSYILQFDVGDRVRLIAFSRAETAIVDPDSLREVWLDQKDFYGALEEWSERFNSEWLSFSKTSSPFYLQ
jgi:hypothetical protein